MILIMQPTGTESSSTCTCDSNGLMLTQESTILPFRSKYLNDIKLMV